MFGSYFRKETIPISHNDSWKYRANFGGESADIFYKSDGSIDEERTYTKCYLKQIHKNDKVSDNKKKSSKDKEGCLTKIWKAPFRLLWWIFKKALILLSFGILSNLLNSEEPQK